MKARQILLSLTLLIAGLGFLGGSLLASPLRETISTFANPSIPNPEIPRLSVAQAQALKGVVYVDVRREAQFAKGHIPGAISMPRQTMDRAVHQLPHGLPLALYCT